MEGGEGVAMAEESVILLHDGLSVVHHEFWHGHGLFHVHPLLPTSQDHALHGGLAKNVVSRYVVEPS